MVRRSPHSIGKPFRAPTTAPVPARVPAAPTVVAPLASTGSLIKDGFMWGLGSGLAHTLVNSMFRPATTTVATAPAVPAVTTGPSQVSAEYAQCMKDFDDPVACRSLLPK